MSEYTGLGSSVVITASVLPLTGNAIIDPRRVKDYTPDGSESYPFFNAQQLHDSLEIIDPGDFVTYLSGADDLDAAKHCFCGQGMAGDLAIDRSMMLTGKGLTSKLGAVTVDDLAVVALEGMNITSLTVLSGTVVSLVNCTVGTITSENPCNFVIKNGTIETLAVTGGTLDVSHCDIENVEIAGGADDHTGSFKYTNIAGTLSTAAASGTVALAFSSCHVDSTFTGDDHDTITNNGSLMSGFTPGTATYTLNTAGPAD